jgi:hypothetical protein
MKQYIPSAIISVAVILGCWILNNAYKYKHKSNETITVTGLSEVDFNSNLAVWGGTFSRSGATLSEAYAILKADEDSIRNYLVAKGVNEDNIEFLAVTNMKEYDRSYNTDGQETSATFKGYSLTGNVRVTSGNIILIEKLSREVTELLQKGIEFNSESPSYYYTQLNDLKIDLLAKASADARKRAETIAKNSGGSLGDLKNATMGVFQITGKNSNEDYSYGGVFNTSSMTKTASVTLKVNYQIK